MYGMYRIARDMTIHSPQIIILALLSSKLGQEQCNTTEDGKHHGADPEGTAGAVVGHGEGWIGKDGLV